MRAWRLTRAAYASDPLSGRGAAVIPPCIPGTSGTGPVSPGIGPKKSWGPIGVQARVSSSINRKLPGGNVLRMPSWIGFDRSIGVSVPRQTTTSFGPRTV
jgi:hypothetical protein